MEQAVLPNQKRNGLGRAALARIKFGQSKTRVQGGKKNCHYDPSNQICNRDDDEGNSVNSDIPVIQASKGRLQISMFFFELH